MSRDDRGGGRDRDGGGGGGREGGGGSKFGRGPPPDTSKMVSLKVDNLTYRTTGDDLEYLFEKYGKVGDVYIPKDHRTRESRGFAFVRFYDKRDAEDAMEALDGRQYDGRELRVEIAKYGRPDNDRSRGGGDRGGGGGFGRDRGGDRGGRDRSRSRSKDRRRSRSKDRRERSRDGDRSRESDRGKDRSKSRSRSRS